MRSCRRARILVAVAEALVAIVLAGLAWWCWHRGVIVTVRNGVALNRIEGCWWAAATGAATLAGILLLDMVRMALAGRSTSPGGGADPVFRSARATS